MIRSVILLCFVALTACAQGENSKVTESGAVLEKLGDGFKFTEGPVSDKKGNVFFTDQPNNKIMRWDAATKKITVFSDKAGRSNGMYFDKKGNLIACADENNQLWSFDKKGNPTVLIADYQGKLLNGPNDVWVHPNGGMYFTDPLYKRDYWKRSPEKQQDGEHVYYLSPDRKTVTRVDEKLKRPNGIIGSPDGRTLFVADIGASKLFKYTIGNDGKLSDRKEFAPHGSDGMILDSQGNLYITNKGVTVFDPNGNKIEHIPVPGEWTANVCFGGKENNLLFITAGDSVYGIKMRVKGAK
jgi:gluconolactonase